MPIIHISTHVLKLKPNLPPLCRCKPSLPPPAAPPLRRRRCRSSSALAVPAREPVSPPEPPIPERIFSSGAKSGTYTPGDSTFYSLIDSYAGAGDFGSLEKVLHRMRRERRVLVERSFISIFKAYGRAGLPEMAIDWFDRMVDEFQCKRTVRSFNSVLNIIIQNGLYNRGLEFYSYVISSSQINISPNVLSYNLAVKAACKMGMVDRAVELFREMPLRSCVPDVFTYCTLMDGLCKEGRIEEAVSLLDEMQIEGCFPSAVTYNVLINGLCKKGDLRRAAKLVDNMLLKGCAPNEVTYNTLIHGLCLRGKLDKAVDLLNRMVAINFMPNDVTYGTIINGLVRLGRAVDGLQVLKFMVERGSCANQYVYSTLLSGLFKEGKFQEARRLWQDIVEERCEPNTVMYSAFIDGLCQEGKPEEAKEVLLEMMNKGIAPNAFTYSSLLRGFFRTDKSEKAILMWEELENNNDFTNAVCYSVLIHGLCAKGKLEKATMAIVIMESSKKGNISHALNLLNSMLHQECDPDLYTCDIFLKALSEKLNPPQDGREFLDELVLRLFKRQRVFADFFVLEFSAVGISAWVCTFQVSYRRTGGEHVYKTVSRSWYPKLENAWMHWERKFHALLSIN
ncbi:hypothetical protein NL676_013371 [Syzygium grande]|nr:hypothetical protein NL676_013371 [Syzygium grande]